MVVQLHPTNIPSPETNPSPSFFRSTTAKALAAGIILTSGVGLYSTSAENVSYELDIDEDGDGTVDKVLTVEMDGDQATYKDSDGNVIGSNTVGGDRLDEDQPNISDDIKDDPELISTPAEESAESFFPSKYFINSEIMTDLVEDIIDGGGHSGKAGKSWGFRGNVVGTGIEEGQEFWLLLENPIEVLREDGNYYWAAPSEDGKMGSILSGKNGPNGGFSRRSSGSENGSQALGQLFYHRGKGDPTSGQQVIFDPKSLNGRNLIMNDDLKQIQSGQPYTLEASARVFTGYEELSAFLGEEVSYVADESAIFKDFDSAS
jgi:hypothetical protein